MVNFPTVKMIHAWQHSAIGIVYPLTPHMKGSPLIMKGFPLLAILFIPMLEMKAQALIPDRPFGLLYPTQDDYIRQQYDTSCQLRKIKDVRVDSLIERFWFADKQKGMVKETFALSFEGRLYVLEKCIRKSLPATFHPHTEKESKYYYPALEAGRYLYFEILSDDRNPDLSIAMGVMGGVVGNALGEAMTDPSYCKSAIVFDSFHQQCFTFDCSKDVQNFLRTYYPALVTISSPNEFKFEDVRKLFATLNQQ